MKEQISELIESCNDPELLYFILSLLQECLHESAKDR